MSYEKGYLRIGKLSKIDYPNGKASVTYEDLNDSTTATFSFLAWQYWMPKEGDQVLVAHQSNGTCAAVILGPVWHDGHRPRRGRKNYTAKITTANTGTPTSGMTTRPLSIWRS